MIISFFYLEGPCKMIFFLERLLEISYSYTAISSWLFVSSDSLFWDFLNNGDNQVM